MPSSCIDVCAVDDERCVACGRTLAEIAAWGTMSEAEQRAWMDEHATAGDESVYRGEEAPTATTRRREPAVEQGHHHTRRDRLTESEATRRLETTELRPAQDVPEQRLHHALCHPHSPHPITGRSSLRRRGCSLP